MDRRQTFTYNPLRHLDHEIRILSLLQGYESSTIKCNLVTVHLAECPVYDAISYTWGEPDKLGRTIMVNDNCFPVRANLWSALYNIRHTREDQTLWIDAICINQDDLEERSHQVRQMSQIFAQARYVYAWVGDESHDSNIALSMLRELDSGSPISKWNKNLKLNNAWSKWNAIFNLFLRPYWSRVWIIQEIAMARQIKICCGRDSIPWELLTRAISILEFMLKTKHKIRTSKSGLAKDAWATILSGILDTHPLQLDRQRALRSASHSDAFNIDVLLGVSDRSSCYDIRDKLYGILNLIQDSKLPVDYTRDNFLVFGDMVQYIEQEEVRGTTLIRDFVTIRFSQCCQSLLKGPHSNTTNDKRTVKVRGLCGGPISFMGSYYHAGRDGLISPEEAMRVTGELYGAGQSQRQFRSGSQQRRYLMKRLRLFSPVAAVKAIRADKFDARKSVRGPNAVLISALRSWTRVCQQSMAISERPALEKGSRNPKPRFFLGSRGQVGFVPAQALKGDFICQFAGSDVIAVMRANDIGSYKLIGRGLILRGLHEQKGKGAGFGSSAKFLIGSTPQPDQFHDQTQLWDIEMDLETLQELTHNLCHWF